MSDSHAEAAATPHSQMRGRHGCDGRRCRSCSRAAVVAATLPAPTVTNSLDVMETEQFTVQRALEGDQAAMRALWTRHAPHIDVVVRRLVGHDLDLAADIAQEVWIQIFRALPSFRGDAQFGTWAHRIAVNRTLNALRRTKRMASTEVDVEDDT